MITSTVALRAQPQKHHKRYIQIHLQVEWSLLGNYYQSPCCHRHSIANRILAGQFIDMRLLPLASWVLMVPRKTLIQFVIPKSYSVFKERQPRLPVDVELRRKNEVHNAYHCGRFRRKRKSAPSPTNKGTDLTCIRKACYYSNA
jgi:hypothetical protein